MTELTSDILSKKTILKQLIIAVLVGLTILFSAVLPAEYGIDPLGIGKATGFSKLYVGDTTTESTPAKPHKLLKLENVGSPANIAKPSESNNPPTTIKLAERSDEISIIVPAGEGLEFKVNMLKYGQLKYEWITDKAELYFDFHGEVKNNSSYFESYTIAYSNNMVGSFIAPFEGPHGWYFKNYFDKDITVKLRLKGQYLLKQ